jgi:metal-dependent hydrolase (beta-lactamase superfamily II)
VINTLEHGARLTGDAPVRLILGGWHLENARARRIDETVRALRAQAGPGLGFCHCTGAAAGRRLWQEFPERCVPVYAGASWSFGS